jgi:hypothetical protein
MGMAHKDGPIMPAANIPIFDPKHQSDTLHDDFICVIIGQSSYYAHGAVGGGPSGSRVLDVGLL